MSDDVTVLVVDDQQAVRDGLVALITLSEGLRVVGSARDGREAIELARELAPDVVLMDLRMPGVDGVAATETIASACPTTAVIVLTTFSDDESITAALAAGARGYLTKDATAETIASAVHTVHGGAMLLDPAVRGHVLATYRTKSRTGADPDPALHLTDRELDVLRLMALGHSNQGIADELHVSMATVKTHVNNLFAKLGVRDRAQAVAYAYQHGIVPAPPPQG